MTAFLIPALAIGAAVSIVLSTLVVALPGTAYALGRFRAWRRRTFTDWTLSTPPVPQPAWDETALDDQPDEVVEAAIYNRLFESVVAGEFPETQRRTS